MTLHLVSVVVLVLAAPARGTRLEQGQRLFAQGDFDAALKVLDAAAQEGGEGPAEAQVQLLRAQCFAARQQFSRAEEAFALALEADPQASLDPGRVDPTVVKLLEGVRARLTGTLVVHATPPGAALTVDGAQAGAAPRTLKLPAGRHALEARWGDGPPARAEVLVRPRREVVVEWVQGAAPAGPAAPGALRPFGDLRGTLELASNGSAPTGGLDLGGGVELGVFRLGLWARLYPYFGLAPRAALSVPVREKLDVFLELEVPLWFRGNGVAVGLGGLGGAELKPLPWLGAFLGVGGEHLFVNPNRNDDTHFLASAGVRLRVP